MNKCYVATALLALSQGLKIKSTTGTEPALTTGVHNLLAQVGTLHHAPEGCEYLAAIDT